MTETKVRVDFTERNRRLFNRILSSAEEIQALEAALESGSIPATEIDETETRLRLNKRRLSALRDKFVVANEGLVFSGIRPFTALADGHEEEDLKAAGRLGIAEAMHTFDPEQAPFGSWAHNPVKKEVIGTVHRSSPQHMHNVREDFDSKPAVRRAIDVLQSAGLVPTDELVAEASGVDLWRVERIRATAAPRSIDQELPTTGDSGMSLGDTLEAEPEADPALSLLNDQSLGREVIRMLPEILSKDELFCVMSYYDLNGLGPMKHKELSKRLRLSREAARKRIVRAHCKVQHPLVLGKVMRLNP